MDCGHGTFLPFRPQTGSPAGPPAAIAAAGQAVRPVPPSGYIPRASTPHRTESLQPGRVSNQLPLGSSDSAGHRRPQPRSCNQKLSFSFSDTAFRGMGLQPVSCPIHRAEADATAACAAVRIRFFQQSDLFQPRSSWVSGEDTASLFPTAASLAPSSRIRSDRQRFRLSDSSAISRRNPLISGAQSSAAADGVGCPQVSYQVADGIIRFMPDCRYDRHLTGIHSPCDPLVIKRHKSSSEPPPRPTMITSGDTLSASCNAETIDAGAPSPCTSAGQENQLPQRPAADRIWIISCKAAPVLAVTTAIFSGYWGSGFL